MAVPAGDILRPRACVVKEKLWKGRQVLKVFFMNPEVLEGWKCEGKKMTTEKIMEWAGAWKEASPAPEFTGTQRVDRADIRVKFSGIYLASYNKLLLYINYLLIPCMQLQKHAHPRWACLQLPLIETSPPWY